MNIMSPVSRTSIGEEVLNQFLDVLSQGIFKPGDKLPSERKLCEMLDVSRPTLRGTIKALCLLGILESKQGGGTYLTSSILNIPLEPIRIQLMLEGKILLEVWEMRKIIEVEIAALCAERATDKDIEIIKGKFEKYEALVRNSADKKAIIQASKDFHIEISRAIKNSTMLSFYSYLSDILTFSRQKTIEVPGSSERAIEFHRDILKGIEARDSEMAKAAMRRHLEDVKKDIMKTLEK